MSRTRIITGAAFGLDHSQQYSWSPLGAPALAQTDMGVVPYEPRVHVKCDTGIANIPVQSRP